MKDLDDQIRKALNHDENELIGEPEDGLRIDQLMLSTFKSRNKFITVIAFIYTFVFMGLAIWCAIRFFNTDVTKELLTWGFGFTICMMAVSMLKMWFWMEMQRIAITREVKKVELLTARMLQGSHYDS
jgi:Family of unknown function (DUF6768)